MWYCIPQGSCWPMDSFPVYVNSYIALLNTKYYMQPSANTTDTFELRREPPSPGQRDTLQEKFPLLRRSCFAHPSPEVEVVPPTRPLAVVPVSSYVTVLAYEALMTRSSHTEQFWWRWRKSLSYICRRNIRPSRHETESSVSCECAVLVVYVMRVLLHRSGWDTIKDNPNNFNLGYHTPLIFNRHSSWWLCWGKNLSLPWRYWMGVRDSMWPEVFSGRMVRIT